MSKKKKIQERVNKSGKRSELYDDIMEHPVAVLIIAVLAILFGVFFILSQNENKPVERSEAISYSGEFEEYEAWRNSREIKFKDGSGYYVYPHTESQDFYDTMMSLKKGTVLHLLINPNNEYVAEIRTDDCELLNFEKSQKEIDAYDNGYIGIGIFSCAAGGFLVFYAVASFRFKRKENERHAKKEKKRVKGQIDSAMRIADDSVKHKVLLEAQIKGYKICYRRVKRTNELVINGMVYDEIKGIIEFEHNLNAVIDNHRIEVGMDKNSYSYIKFDGKRIAEKKRLI